jgi:hypothetical protein
VKNSKIHFFSVKTKKLKKLRERPEEMGKGSSKDTAMVLNVLIKKEKDCFIAHCLELDIVATSPKFDQVKKEIIDLVMAQVDYAFSNDNLNYLYHPAPSEIWAEFYACKGQIEEKVEIKSAFKKPARHFVPPWIIARMCGLDNLDYA